MTKEKKYTVREIAKALNVPRTTVTDWISRYPQYMEFRLQGKRKVYTEATVNVLKEISLLRNQVLSSFRIEEELKERYSGHKPVHEPVLEQYSNQNSLLLSKGNNRDLKINYWHIFALFCLVSLLFCAGIIAFLKIEKFIKENQKLDIRGKNALLIRLKDTDKNPKQNLMEIYNLEKQTSELMSSPMAESCKADNLEKQKDEFKKTILKMEETEKSAKEAEILLLRNKFAEERLELLKALDAAQKNREKMEMIITQLQAQCYEQNMTVKSLSEENISETTEKAGNTDLEPIKE